VLKARLEQAIQRARRGLGGVALVRVGIEWMNEAGEELISALDQPWPAVLTRLRDRIREIDTIAQLDDGFLILVEDTDARLVAARSAQAVLGDLRQPMTSRAGTFQAAASIGVGVFPEDGDGATALMAHVNRARQLAMASGPGALQFSSLQLDDALARRIYLERGIEEALERGDFRLVYQPQLDIFSGALVGAEALLRWRHRDFGIVSPAEFVPILESSGLIDEVGAWVLGQAALQAKEWLDAGLEVCVSVNVSAKQFGHGLLEKEVAGALEKARLPARLLGIELTESIMLDATDRVLTTLSAIRGSGVHVAVDDFGTGYASLRYVKRFPMDVIKIDREFVRGLPLDTANGAITNAIVALAHSLELIVVAEGVETDAEEEFLKSLHCNVVQGFLHSAPLEPHAFTTWCRGRKAG
jgi:EAL domain-containing protein (putative c-di-GMP-specific phosphodiesterase class I)